MSAESTKNLGAGYSPYVSLKIGDKTLGNAYLKDKQHEPRILQSFKIERVLADGKNANSPITDKIDVETGLGFKATFRLSTIIDPWLENYLLDYYRNQGVAPDVEFKYGYYGSVIHSPTYVGALSELKLSEDYYTLEITVVSQGLSSSYRTYNGSAKTQVFGKTFNSYSELVTAIAKCQGWNIGRIEPTKPISSGVRIEDINISPYQYIKTHCLKNAISTKNEGNYTASVVFEKSGMNFYYVPTTFLDNKYNYKTLKNYNFVYRMLPRGNVISFAPTLNVGAVQAFGKSKNDKSMLFKTITKDTKEVLTTVLSGKYQADDAALNSSSYYLSGSSKVPMIYANAADINMFGQATIKSNINDYAYGEGVSVGATMVIIGDPELNTLQYINVIPMYPREFSINGGRAGVMHPSGGTYLIRGITDEISDTFTTTLNLVKDGTNYNIT